MQKKQAEKKNSFFFLNKKERERNKKGKVERPYFKGL